MPRDVTARVTPEEIVGLILDEMQQSIVPGWYTDYVNSLYRVYLYREDLDQLAPLEAAHSRAGSRALDEELAKLNRPLRSVPLMPAQKKKRCEPLGSWIIEFLENSDDDAARNRMIVKSAAPAPPPPESLEGPPTVRVPLRRPESGDDSATRRTSFSDRAAGDNASTRVSLIGRHRRTHATT